MEPATYALVLASTGTHAYWNFLVKRSGGGTIFLGLSKLLEVAVFAPAFLLWALPGLRGHAGTWPLVLGGALLTLLAYVALGRAYQLGDLSAVYPVARGAILLFLPPLGWLVFGERPSAVGWAALACILAGILVLQLPALRLAAVTSLGAGLRGGAALFALLTGLAGAAATTWDKRAVQVLPAFAYFYAYTALVALAYGAYLVGRHPRAALAAEWRTHRWPILQVAVCNTASYVLVLIALRTGTSTYVVALRQLSIVLGALLGWRILGEHFGAPKRLGVALLVAGCVLVAFAR
jgi:drug/metabolite transporter (DMT)-like permease